MLRGALEAGRVGVVCLLSIFMFATFASAVAEAAENASLGKVTQAELLLTRPKFIYSSMGKKDPFLSLVSGEFHGEGATGLVNVGDMELVGVLWGGKVMLAMVEDSRGRGYVLRVGDPVMNGIVKSITKDSIVIEQVFYGEAQTVTIPMKGKEGEDHEK